MRAQEYMLLGISCYYLILCILLIYFHDMPGLAVQISYVKFVAPGHFFLCI